MERIDDATQAVVDPRFAQPTSLPPGEAPSTFSWFGPLLLVVLLALFFFVVQRTSKKS
jgi:hypothetical protein